MTVRYKRLLKSVTIRQHPEIGADSIQSGMPPNLDYLFKNSTEERLRKITVQRRPYITWHRRSKMPRDVRI